MISRLHPKFRRDFERLPADVQTRAREAYKRFSSDPFHPSLRFKKLHGELSLWSVRISDSYRAVGVRKNDNEVIWFFIGTHAEYDQVLRTR